MWQLNFRIHDVGYLENEIQETFEELVHNEKYLHQPGSHETHIHKCWFTDVMLYACLHLRFEGDKSTKGEEKASSKRIHGSQTCVGSSQNLR